MIGNYFCPLLKTGLNVTECFRMLMECVEEQKPRMFTDSTITRTDNKQRTKSLSNRSGNSKKKCILQ